MNLSDTYQPGSKIQFPEEIEELCSYDGPLTFIDRATVPGMAVFFHAIELERYHVSYRAALVDLDEARSIADGATDIVAPFLRAESALLRLDREGFHVVELSMADPETLPEPGVRFDAPSEPAPAA